LREKRLSQDKKMAGATLALECAIWEAIGRDLEKKKEMGAWLSQRLSELGLSRKEAWDFKLEYVFLLKWLEQPRENLLYTINKYHRRLEEVRKGQGPQRRENNEQSAVFWPV